MSVAKNIKNTETTKNNNGLLVGNPVYKPFRYPWCYDAWLTQQRIHWLPEEVPLGDDVRDWQKNLSLSFFANLSHHLQVVLPQATNEFFVVSTMHHSTMDI